VGTGDWLSQMMQTSQPAGWLTQATQTGAAGPGFDTSSEPMAGTMPATSLATPNPLQTHTA